MRVADLRENETVISDTAFLELPSKRRISLTLEGSDVASSDKNGDGKSSAGDEVVFTLAVGNVGTVGLTGVVVQDAALDGLNCQQFLPFVTGEELVSGPCMR